LAVGSIKKAPRLVGGDADFIFEGFQSLKASAEIEKYLLFG
jgi:hypothetical protein